MSEPLVKSRRFPPVLVTQTLGAFNANLFKTAPAVLILHKAMIAGSESLVALAGAVAAFKVLPARQADVAPELKGKPRRQAPTQFMTDVMTKAAFRLEATTRPFKKLNPPMM